MHYYYYNFILAKSPQIFSPHGVTNISDYHFFFSWWNYFPLLRKMYSPLILINGLFFPSLKLKMHLHKLKKKTTNLLWPDFSFKLRLYFLIILQIPPYFIVKMFTPPAHPILLWIYWHNIHLACNREWKVKAEREKVQEEDECFLKARRARSSFLFF